MGLFSKKKEEKSMLPDLTETNAELPSLPQYGSSASLKADVPVGNGGMMPRGGEQHNMIKNEIHNPISSGDETDMQKSGFDPLPHYEGQGMPARIVAEPSNVMEDLNASKASGDAVGHMHQGMEGTASEDMHHEMGHENMMNHEPLHEPRTIEMNQNTPVPSNVKRSQPIYIRLDKFKAGLESFEDIKGKLTEIEDLLVKIREMKDKEERELEEWEREIQVVKARIEQIDNDVFRNVE